ncbi:MAG: SMC-Scp complex subunit ScpB [Pseudomonadota bacterium]|nr:SMC-Scp complex subunit ScpB [Pseudomonadota bacterium]
MTTMRDDTTRAEQARILEAALAAAGEPVSASRLKAVFAPEPLSTAELEAALDWLAQRYEGSALELVQVAGGWRLQVRAAYALHVQRLQPERPARYSRAVMETLALIAYRQPITRGEIEAVRGVAVSTNVLRTLIERGWVHEMGRLERPGRPALYGTTPTFLADLNLRELAELPPLPAAAEIDPAAESSSTETTHETLPPTADPKR